MEHSAPYVGQLNSSSRGQNGRHLADDIFKRIFMNERVELFTKISLKFPKSQIDSSPALVQIMIWRRIGDETFSEPMLTRFTAAHMRH